MQNFVSLTIATAKTVSYFKTSVRKANMKIWVQFQAYVIQLNVPHKFREFDRISFEIASI